jgi:hypothetical protein
MSVSKKIRLFYEKENLSKLQMEAIIPTLVTLPQYGLPGPVGVSQ